MTHTSCPIPRRRLPILLAILLSSPLALARTIDGTSIHAPSPDGNTLDGTVMNGTLTDDADAHTRADAKADEQAGTPDDTRPRAQAGTPTSAPAETRLNTRGSAEALADESDTLAAVHITAIRSDGFKPLTVKAGSFRGASVMDVPSTINVVTQEVLEQQATGGLYDAVRNTAGVTRQQNGGDTWDQLVIRGIPVENRTNYRLNGSMSIVNMAQVPMENKERVEVLKGASALYYGFTAPSGIVNYVTKRATLTPISSMGLKIDDQGSAIVYTDIGRTFGEQRQYGLRLNAAGGRIGNYLDGTGDGNRGFVSAAFDWRVTNRLVVSIDADYDRRRTVEQAGIALPGAVDGIITLPHAVDPKKLIGPDWAVFRTESNNVQLRTDYALTDTWTLTLEAGRAQVERDRTLPIFRFNDAAGMISGDGNIRGNIQHGDNITNLLRTELTGIVETGPLTHDLTLGIARANKTQDPIYQQVYTVASQNLYNPVPITNARINARPTSPTTEALETTDTGTYVIDRIEFSPQWQLIGGLRYSKYRLDQGNDHYRASKTTPMAAVIYKPRNDLSVYASYAKGLEEGETAPSGSDNVGQRLQPGVSDQFELGTRMELGNGTQLSAASFDIDRPGYYTDTSNIFTADGKQRYRGLELSLQGRLTRQLAWQASAALLDPEFRSVGDEYNGKLPENAAKRTGSLFLSYALDAVPGLSFNGGAYFTGRRPVDDLNQAWLGGVTLYSLGARYRSAILGKQTILQLNIDNVADKRYWAGAGTRLSAGAPRTIKAGIRIDF
ncbi:MAG: TonB-dependent siderophore receptor [Lautropia sp.]|nr:TonB-dependent siderophore receptor [Lautropia sp.]